MDLSSLRFRYHLTNAVVVIAVLAVFQYLRSSVDPQFLATVAGFFLLFSLAIDVVRPLESASDA